MVTLMTIEGPRRFISTSARLTLGTFVLMRTFVIACTDIYKTKEKGMSKDKVTVK